MAGNDFRKVYKDVQSTIILSEDARERIAVAADDIYESLPGAQNSLHREPRRNFGEGLCGFSLCKCVPRRRWNMAVVCVCAVFLICGLVLLGIRGGNDRGLWFEIEAYALNADIDNSPKGVIIPGINGLGSPISPDDGIYAETTFVVRGVGIAAVDLLVDKGEIYTYRIYDHLLPGDSRIAAAEAKAGEFAEYDLVSTALAMMYDSKSDTVPSKQWYKISMYKKHGVSIHIEAANDGSLFTSEEFGFWVKAAAAPSFDEQNPNPNWEATLRQFNGVALSVTVRYVDGTSEERSYRLRVQTMPLDPFAYNFDSDDDVRGAAGFDNFELVLVPADE